MKKRILFIQLRNLGDAVISTKVVNSLKENYPEITLDLLIRKDFLPIFANNPYINKIYFTNYPVGTRKNFKFKDFINLLKLIYKLRNKYDIVINNIGDFREDFLGRILNSQENISPKFDKRNPFSSYIRQIPIKLSNSKIWIPDNIINIYEIYNYFLKELGCQQLLPPKIFLERVPEKRNIIGIHPFSSEKSKTWDFKNWIILINEILKTFPNYTVYLFGSSYEKHILEEIKAKTKYPERVYIKVGNLEEFFTDLSMTKLLIGLDSFAIHAAYALNVKNIAIFGSSDYKVFKTPITYPIAYGEKNCSFYPCNNKPKCYNTNFEFICLNSVEIKEILKNIKEILSKGV